MMFLLSLFFSLSVSPLWGTPLTLFQEANASYQQGEKATTFEERRHAFNQALFLYSQAEEQFGTSNATLNHALADSYFQLGEYPWAILYYQRALKQDPRNALLKTLLEETQQKAGLPITSHDFTLTQQLLFIPFLSLSQRFEVFFWIALLTLLVCVTAIWLPYTWMHRLATGCVILACLGLLNLGFSYYFTPLEGIIVTTTGLYREPSEQQPQIASDPLLAGTQVHVLQVLSDGNWLKIADSTGLIGYVPVSNLRLI
jgi:tetratricopeptide (TPR) repeat protein